MSRDELTLGDLVRENVDLDEQLTNAQHTIDIQEETIDSLQTEIERLKADLEQKAHALAIERKKRLKAQMIMKAAVARIESQHDDE